MAWLIFCSAMAALLLLATLVPLSRSQYWLV